MKVIATLDYIDGKNSKTRVIDIEQIGMNGLLMILSESDVVGITFTKMHGLKRLQKKIQETL